MVAFMTKKEDKSMPVDKDHYVIVNIWTSSSNKAIPGVNVGHVSLGTAEKYISLWPNYNGEPNPFKPKPFKSETPKFKGFFTGARTDYVCDYTQDCIREAKAESGRYELSLRGYKLCLLPEDMIIEHNKLYIEAGDDGSIKYYVIAPSGKLSTGVILATDNLPNMQALLHLVNEDYDGVELQNFLPDILQICRARKDVHQDFANCVMEKKHLYVELNEDGSLHYKVINPMGIAVTNRISREDLIQIDPLLGDLHSPLTFADLSKLQPYTYDILEIAHNYGDIKPVIYRKIYRIEDLKPGETVYRFDKENKTQDIVTEIPAFSPDRYKYRAVKIRNANIRIVLYSMDIGAIETEFDRLRVGVSGWTMQGSNMFTRTFCESTTENCASLAYRCLNAGGLSDGLQSAATSQTSSIVSPDDLIRKIVATKEIEAVEYYGNPEDWTIPGVEETPISTIRDAYIAIGKNASVSDDILPALAPSIPTKCSIQ